MDFLTLLTATSPQWIHLSTLVLRVFIGICFFIHGLGKLGLVGSGNMAGFESWLKSLGFPFPRFQARLAMLTEVFGGACLAAGFLMRLSCCFLIITMIVAALLGHKGGGYLITNNPPGNEYTINLTAALIAILLLGPGPFSLDWILFS